MLENLVIVRHKNDSGKYLFKLPKSVNLCAGDVVSCDTARGKDQVGTCCCDSFLADPKVVCPLFGTQPNLLKGVTGKVEFKRFEVDESEGIGVAPDGLPY